MDLYSSIESLLKNYNGVVSFSEAVEILEADYSEETIYKFLKNNKKYFEYDGVNIASFQIKVDLFLNELKALIVKYKLNIANVKDTVVIVLGIRLHKTIKNRLHIKKYVEQPANRFFYNELESSHIWDDEFFSTPEKQYMFTSQLFEFLLMEEFGEYGLFTTPSSIIKLLCNLLPSKKKIKLYNPTAGFLNLATALALSKDSSLKILASELHPSIYEYGKLFSEINNVRIDYTCIDSCDEVMKIEASKYDVILANLPFAVKQQSPHVNDRKYSELSLHIITESLKKLAVNGRAFFLINDGVLFSLSKEKLQFRKEIVDNGMLKTVISLPSKILPQTSVKTSLLVFENTDNSNKVQFINSSESNFVITNPNKTISLKTRKISSLIKWKTNGETDVVQEPDAEYGQNEFNLVIPIKDIQDHEYDLSTGKYIAEQETYGDDYAPLSSILHPQKTSSASGKLIYPFVRISELNGETLKDFANLNTTSRKGRILKKPSILIGTVGESFKPTYFDGKFDIEVSNNVAIFEFDNKKVLPPYLIQELNAEYVQKQMSLLSKGSAMKHITVKDILSVRIKLPDINEQSKLLSDRMSFISEHTLQIKEDKQTISDAKIFKLFRHEIGNILEGPEGFLRKLPGFLKSNNIDLNTTIIKGEPETVGDMVISSTKKLQQIHWIMDNMKGVLHSSKEFFSPENVELKPFIEKCLKNEVLNGEIKCHVIVDAHYTETKKYFAEIDKNQFENVIRNMVVNAMKHGKTDKPLNLVINIIDMSEEVDENEVDNNVSICFINDGIPLPADFTIEKFIQFGKTSGGTSGHGIGGYLIHRVIKNHNGFIDLGRPGCVYEVRKDIFVESSVEFILTIPKNQ